MAKKKVKKKKVCRPC